MTTTFRRFGSLRSRRRYRKYRPLMTQIKSHPKNQMNVYRLPLVRFPTSFAVLLTLKLRLVARALLPIVGDIGLPPEPAPPVSIPPCPEGLDPEPPDDFTMALGPEPLGPEPGGIGPSEFSGVTRLEDCE